MGRAVLIFALFVLGGLPLVLFGHAELKVARGSASAPDRLTASELARRGPAGNARVVVSEFALLDRIVLRRAGGRRRSSVRYVPVVARGGPEHLAHEAAAASSEGWPAGEPFPLPERFAFIALIRGADGEKDVAGYSERSNLAGVIVNDVAWIGDPEWRWIRMSYRGVELRRCPVLEVGRTPIEWELCAALLSLGIASMVTGIGVLVREIFRQWQSELRAPKRTAATDARGPKGDRSRR